jgi:penicillin-binding protein-related factor A (putative recombinase)
VRYVFILPFIFRESDRLSKEGKIFESSIEQSCSDQLIWYFRVRDVNLPPDVRMRVKLPQNKYDSLMYYHGHLFSMEMKSTKSKSISFSESIIKQHQIDSLKEASKFKGVISGFLFNFREVEGNPTYFVRIDDFINYKNIAENQLEHKYLNKVNKSSIPIGICQEIGVKVTNVKKVNRYRYYINKLLDELIEKYGT